MEELNYGEIREMNKIKEVKIARGEQQLDDIDCYRGLAMALFKISMDHLSNAHFNGSGHLSPETNRAKIKMARRSWDWVHKDYRNYPFSFSGVCEFLGYDHKKIKEMVYEKLEKEGTLTYFKCRK